MHTYRFGRRQLLLTFCLIATSALTAMASPQSPAVMNIQDLGKGTAELNGPWQFHIGDDMRWAQPAIDDAAGQGGWETIRPDAPWGAQGHYAYAGFAWYRLRLHITPATGSNAPFQLLLPTMQDACESTGTANWPVATVPCLRILPGPH
jgi:phosphoserine phosphatase RsbU/P